MKAQLDFEGEKETQYFYQLAPENILAAVELLGVRCTGRCVALNSLENRVYEVEIETSGELVSPSDRFRVVKFYRPGRWSEQQIAEEHEFLADLKAQDIPVVCPLPLAGGRTSVKLESVDIWCAVFPKQRGRNPDEFDDEQLERMGRLLARVHTVGATKQASHRLEITPDTYGIRNLEFLLESSLIPADLVQSYSRAVERICEISRPWFASVEQQRIHGDCHIGNILWGSEGPFLVDFDDMLRGPCVQDLWLIVPGRDDYSRGQFDVLVSAYEEMRNFDRSSLRLIEVLRALRFIRFSAWIGKRWGDPAFPPIFPRFGTHEYWREQIADLENQLSFIERCA